MKYGPSGHVVAAGLLLVSSGPLILLAVNFGTWAAVYALIGLWLIATVVGVVGHKRGADLILVAMVYSPLIAVCAALAHILE